MSEQNSGGDKPKIIIDEDWKSQAAAEKERLAQRETASGAAPAAGAAPAGATGAQAPAQAAGGKPASPAERELPPATFATLVSTLVTQILFALGMVGDANSRRRYYDPTMAKHQIDMLAMLEEKTKGNLSDDERAVLDSALYEVRMAYVRVAQQSGL